MTLRIYDANRVQVSFAGIPVQGFSDGEFLTINKASDAFTSVVGTDGEVARSKTNDRRATIEIKLLQTSLTNDLFAAVHKTDLESNGGAGVGSLLVTDLNGRSLYAAGNCWISRAPDVAYGREAGERVWTLECDELQEFTGGNL